MARKKSTLKIEIRDTDELTAKAIVDFLRKLEYNSLTHDVDTPVVFTDGTGLFKGKVYVNGNHLEKTYEYKPDMYYSYRCFPGELCHIDPKQYQ